MEWIPLTAKILNTVILLVLAFGLMMRFRPKIHVPVMVFCFIADVINVILVETFARSKGKGAVEQGIESFTEGATFLEQFHILVSTICILGYIVAVVTGIRLLKRRTGRTAHKVNAAIFVFTRVASYVTSFWMGS